MRPVPRARTAPRGGARGVPLAGLAAPLALLASASGAPLPEGPAPGFVRLEGLSTVEAIAQTPDGWLWFGGATGLHRSDGRSVTALPGPWGADAVRELHTDHAGNLWVVSGRASLVRGEGPTVDFSSQEARLWRGQPRPAGGFDWWQLPAGRIWTAVIDPEDDRGASPRAASLLFTDGPQVFRVSPGREQPSLVHTAPGEVLALRRTPAGALLVAGSFGLDRVDSAGQVTRLLQETTVRLFAGPGDGLALTERDLVDLATGTRTDRRALGLHRVLAADDLLVAGVQEGIALLHQAHGTGAEGAFVPHAIPALSGKQLLAVFRDREGTLWIATLGTGIFRSVPTLAEAPALGDGYVVPFSVLADREGGLWITSTVGLHHLAPDGRLHTRPTRELGLWSPRGMTELPGGRLIIAGDGHGILVVHGDQRELIPARWGGPVTGVFALPDGGLAVALGAGGLKLVPPGAASLRAALDRAPTLTAADGLCGGDGAMLVADREGGLYLAQFPGGVAYRAPGGTRWRCITRADGLPSGDPVTLLADPEDGVWVGFTDATGLAHLRGPRVLRVPPDSGLGTAHVHGLALDEHGRLWLTGDRGVMVVRRADLVAVRDGARRQLTALRFGLSDGLPSETCMARFSPTIARLPDGRMAVPTLSGLVLLRGDPPARPLELTTVVERVRVRGTERQPARELVLHADDLPIEIGVTAATSIRPDGVRFEYTFGGDPERWALLDRGRTLHLPSLEPGAHVMHVRAVDELGHPIGSPAVLALRMLPPWWRHPLALVALALALVALGMGALQVRIYRLRLQARAVAQERQRLARELHDGLAQGFTAIGMLLDVLLRKAAKEAPQLGAMLEQTQKVVAQCSTLARNAIWNLRSLGANLSLASAIDAAIHRMEAPGIDVALVTHGKPGPVVTEALYELPLIAQEAVVNAIRHSGGTRITVTLEEAPRELRLRIEDDGRGFDPASVAPDASGHGFGLTGMRERAARLGGEVTIASAPGQGTRVLVRCPRDGGGGAGSAEAPRLPDLERPEP